MSYLKTNSLIKIRTPSPLTKNFWAIEEKSKKVTFAVPMLAVAMTVACANPITKDDLFSMLSERFKKEVDVIEKTLLSLISKNIILLSEILPPSNDQIESWRRANWDAAAHYHFFTWDAPFLDYTKEGGGHDLDRKKMISYQAEQPDVHRYKSYHNATLRSELPKLSEFSYSMDMGGLSLSEKIKYLLALSFGKLREKACHWSDIPLIQRTSPSGGCRHPTEGYFLSYVDGISHGWYHVQTDPPSLVYLSPLIDGRTDILGTIILTTIFDRNMFRYREPRTFRTIHMDAGHLLQTIEVLASELDFETQIDLNFNESDILSNIKASQFEEGVMAVIHLRERL